MIFFNEVNGYLEFFKNFSLIIRIIYFGNIDEFCDDFCFLLGSWFVKNY